MARSEVRAVALLALFSILCPCDGWRQWEYKSETPDDWKDVWGYEQGPRGRRGHSLSMLGSRLIMFGGRDNEIQRQHVPKTYNIIEVEGTLEFQTYEDYPVSSNYNASCKPIKTCIPLTDAESGNTETCSYSWSYGGDTSEMSQEAIKAKEDQCGFVPAGLFYNDVWEYDINCGADVEAGEIPERYADMACEKTGWKVLHPGARNGACVFQAGKEICTLPSERWHHGSAMFDDKTMLIYGGFSQRCEDYCDDMWSFDLRDNSWMEIYPIGSLGDNESPGKRWKFSLLSGVTDPFTNEQSMIFFGGHRLWHGFSLDNSQDNNWDSYDMYPKGGYLNDLWTYTKRTLLPDEDVPMTSEGYGEWSRKLPVEKCQASPGVEWSSRNDITCRTDWPKERAGHAGIYDKGRNGIWIHGGFTAYYPYISTDGAGSGNGIQALKVGGFTPYPTYPFYLDDLWFYDIKNGNWTEYSFTGNEKPDRRTDHIMILASKQGLTDRLIMFGGYYNNHHYDDTWYFDIANTRWQRKKSFVHANWPDSCVDDVDFYNDPLNECIELQYPEPLLRAQVAIEDESGQISVRRGEILPYEEEDQAGYFGTGSPPPHSYYGLHDNATEYMVHVIEQAIANQLADTVLKTIPTGLLDGTPIAPYAASGPRQYARKYNAADMVPAKYAEYADMVANVSGVIWERCTSAKGVPTTGGDGLFGRSSIPVEIPQPRRKRYGWDGCREEDMDDGVKLWTYPDSRSDHTAFFYPEEGLLMFYGGVGYSAPQEASLEMTHETTVLSDFWTYNINNCNNNCSDHGACEYGFCMCDPGYYGLDCSNQTCPGDFCYYDEITSEQICKHCCYAGYEHTDDDVFVPDVKKVFCSKENVGHSNGICDGFGTCQCAPPFIGEDCSIKDCPYNCSFNGYCDVQFPVSRCVCSPGYFGSHCQYRICLNNCSYPNGNCDFDTGECSCSMVYNPFENFREWVRWGGEDCSYLAAYAAGERPRMRWLQVVSCVVVVFALVAGDCFAGIALIAGEDEEGVKEEDEFRTGKEKAPAGMGKAPSAMRRGVTSVSGSS
mmetsp:Transcript_24240/g.48206  ORF Transcript_24240/g.48206 Transcript_24240/m.48206 type:complete len:1055 (-) Transcript_24240:30-3194(-)|eukprot:CAMPEP_0182475724 /NCGR_PEP_ID=MMETSP1319-20130603/27832_1 /TAXON_ID=172717 /ORGANISM="Bolidomonas pacifica, Strain RCC208" /LENGTH=1054 /DNA_ID=CAMNT_0024676745 /DNA_START=110 /DNA_END=3274 /DNA_ORIENTATION=+